MKRGRRRRCPIRLTGYRERNRILLRSLGQPSEGAHTVMKISKRASGIEASATLAISARARELKAAGENVIDFGLGEPDFPTPPNICAAGIRAIEEGKTRYTPASGIKELKEAACGKLDRENGLSYEPSQVIVSCGAKFALYAVIQALVDPGDEVLVPAPYWVSYPAQVRLAGAEPVSPLAGPEAGFKMTAEALSRAATPRTRLVIINSPCNPTGAVYSRGELEALAEVIVEKDMAVISDEIYEWLIYDGAEQVSLAGVSDEMYARTITVNGHSKAYCMTGWRMGYAAGDAGVIAAAGKIQSQSTSNPPTPSQWAAVEALEGDQSSVAAMREEFDARRRALVEGLNSIDGVECLMPGGAFYAFPDVKGLLGRRMAGTKVADAAGLAKLALEEAKVALLPGEAFGSPGFLRLSYVTDVETLNEGVARLSALFGGE